MTSADETQDVLHDVLPPSPDIGRRPRPSKEGTGNGLALALESGSRLAQLLFEEEIASADLEGLDDHSQSPLLGTGGFGEVRKVHWRGTPVAVKLAHQDIDPVKKQLFLRELELMVRCRHPNIVQFLGYVDKPFMIVMEYLPMGDLRAYWQRRRGMSKGHKTTICIDVLRALAYLHNRKPSSIIHRDIKPTNVLITKSGVAKLTDFGLSRISGPQTPSPSNSHPGSHPGSRAPSKHGGSAFANFARMLSPGPSKHDGEVFGRMFSPGPSRHKGEAFGSGSGNASPAERAVASGTAFASFVNPTHSPPSARCNAPTTASGMNANAASGGITLVKVPISIDVEASPRPARRASSPRLASPQYAKDATAIVGTAQYMAYAPPSPATHA